VTTMSYQSIKAGNTDPRVFTLVARANGSPLTAGTVHWYLKALNGANAGKWWRISDNSWQVAEVANPMTHQADGHWSRALDQSPWETGVAYLEYAREGGDLHVPVARALKGDGYEAVADTILSRDVASVEASMPAHCLGSVPLAMLKHSLTASPGNVVIYRTNGAIHLTIPVEAAPSANPLTGIG